MRLSWTDEETGACLREGGGGAGMPTVRRPAAAAACTQELDHLEIQTSPSCTNCSSSPPAATHRLPSPLPPPPPPPPRFMPLSRQVGRKLGDRLTRTHTTSKVLKR